jgi:hypothetical protein
MELNKAKTFSILVNHPDAYEQLRMYADHRIETLMKGFLSAQTIEEVKALQKSIEELKRLKTLREEVNGAT